MVNQLTSRVVVNNGSTPNSNQLSKQAVLVDTSGNPLSVPKKMPAQADSAASTVAGLVTDFNALLAKMRTAGLLS